MDSNWNTAQSGAATGSSFGVGPDSNANLDWRSQMQPDARQRVVNKMVETLKSHLPVLVPERSIELQKIAVRFEELIYSFSTSQPDYLKRIALKMFSIERKTQPGLNPSLPNQNHIDPGVGMLQVMNRTTASRQQQPLLQGLPNIPQQSQPMIQNSTMCMQQTNNVTDLQQQRLQMQKNQLQPNQMQQNQMLNQQMILGQQQNLFLASGGANNVDNMQRKMKMQRNAGWQQQQSRQQQPPQQQQHLLSEFQSQQQQLPQQQRPSMMQQREMQMPQQWMQGFPSLLRTQNGNAIDPQRQQQQFIPQQQLQQQQRVVQNVASSTASMDSAAPTGHQGDWQEEIYQRITYLKDTYFTDLREVHQKLSIKLSQLDSIVPPNTRGGEQIEKMKHYKMVLECMMTGLQLGKNSMQIGLKDKLSVYEEQIVSILQNHKKAPQQQPQAGAPSDQLHFPALQQSQPGLQSQELPQQQQPQQMDNQNRLQQQLSTGAMTQPNNLRMPNAMQQGMHNTLHSDQLQASGMGFGSLQQGSMGPTMRSTMNSPQMDGSGAAISSSIMSHTVTMAGMQTNMSFTQVLKPQQQQQEQQIQPQQHMVQTQQQTQQRYLQQHLMQKQKQNQMQLLSEPSDLKPKEGASGMKPGSMFQQYYPGIGPHNGYYHSQLKPGYNPPISAPQNIHSSSPQISHPSPQVDQQGLIPPTQLKSGTPLQAPASPFVPSPSPPVVPSPMIEDTKLGAGLMHNSAAGQTGQLLPANTAQTGQMGQPQAESLAVGTPGISATPVPAEFTSLEAGQGTILSIQVSESETPIQKLARLMRTMPQNQLNAAVKDIASVVSMVDRIPGSALGNGSQAAIDDDLVVMTKCQLQAKNLAHPEGVGGTSGRASSPTKKRKRDSIARKVIREYADQFGGGSFFSTIIKWQAVNPADPYVIV